MSQIKWQAKLTGKLFRASVSREANKQEAIIALYTDDHQAVLPNWNIYCNDEVIDKDFNSFWKLVKDTLMEYQPYIKLDFQDYIRIMILKTFLRIVITKSVFDINSLNLHFCT